MYIDYIKTVLPTYYANHFTYLGLPGDQYKIEEWDLGEPEKDGGARGEVQSRSPELGEENV